MTPPHEDKLARAFRALADEGPRQAPLSVERALRSAWRQQNARRRQMRWSGSVLAALAAAVLVLVFMHPPKEVPRPRLRLAHIAVPELPHTPQSVRLPGQRRVAARYRPRPSQPPGEISTRFYPLQDAATLSPFDYGTLVRVQLPRSALRLVGLPVNEDRFSERISADVLLGQDGLARAVRFVQ